MGSWEDHKENLKTIMKDMMEKGEKDINEVLDTPLTFLMDDLYDKSKKKRKGNKSGSMLEAFGGSNPEAH